jgi:alanine racemase
MYIILLMNETAGRVWAEIYLDRLINNYKLVKRKVHNAKIMAAIKADAYGHGAIEVARALELEGARMFGVASVEEGVELRQAGINSKILILSPILYSQIDAVLHYKLIPTISELGFFKALQKRLKQLRTSTAVHIEVDTGMTRTGIPCGDAADAIRMTNKSSLIRIEGIFSHFPLADGNGSFTQKQIVEFGRLIEQLRNENISPPFVHLANSSGVFKHPGSHFNLVRPGIALYGLTSVPTIQYGKSFVPVMALKSRIVNMRTVPSHTSISYGHTYTTEKKSTIATVSVGYGDGYPRMLSNIGEVLVRGKRAPIVGTICMDLIMIDTTHVPEVSIGDVATLIGRDGHEEITAEECAKKAHTIVYEITSGIGPRVARVFRSKNRTISVRNLLGRWRNGT